ncbi:hypothetical protein DIE07_27690 [Burkholderia sp. Bp9002]|nr:hypothetical protein DIE07_27690 [Burkholderia sp. Bp9002]
MLPLGAWVAFYHHQPWLFAGSVVVAFPVLDALIGRESDRGVKQRARTNSAVCSSLFIMAWMAAVGYAVLRARNAGWSELLGLAVASGLLGGMSMSHSHELMHRTSRTCQALAELAFVVAGYPHYRVVHLLHHAHVGNPAFGSTAYLGLPLWRHVGRSFCAAASRASAHEAAKTENPWENRVVRPVCAMLMLAIFVSVASGLGGLLYLLVAAVTCVLLVEGIGYLQHYGLDATPDNRLGQIAWDVDFWLSNRMFVNNGYHTWHHEGHTDYRPPVAAMPLPGGYLHMLVVALYPKLWFSMMNARVIASRQKD